MKRALLILSLVLMSVSLTAPFWTRWLLNIPQREWVRGIVTGEFPDQPWAGAAVYVGDERSILKADGKFEFALFPGAYIVKVCCSERFEPIRRKVEVKDQAQFVELHAEPLLKVPGRLVVPEGAELNSLASVSARRIYTNSVR